MGTTNYLMLFLAMANFVLIAYNFLIEDSTIMGEIFSNMWIFVLVFLLSYIPISIIIGNWHTKTQISTEQVIRNLEDPIFAKMFRNLLDVQTEKSSKEEIKEFRNWILKIENEKNVDF